MNQLTLLECSKRRLDETYLVVYAIKNEINIKKGDYIEKSDIYSLIGIDIKGFRQFLNIYQDRVNNNITKQDNTVTKKYIFILKEELFINLYIEAKSSGKSHAQKKQPHTRLLPSFLFCFVTR